MLFIATHFKTKLHPPPASKMQSLEDQNDKLTSRLAYLERKDGVYNKVMDELQDTHQLLANVGDKTVC